MEIMTAPNCGEFEQLFLSSLLHTTFMRGESSNNSSRLFARVLRVQNKNNSLPVFDKVKLRCCVYVQ